MDLKTQSDPASMQKPSALIKDAKRLQKRHQKELAKNQATIEELRLLIKDLGLPVPAPYERPKLGEDRKDIDDSEAPVFENINLGRSVALRIS